MFPGSAVILSCISIIHIFGLVQDVSGFVAQSPNRLAPTEPALTLANTSATLLDGSTTTLSQEEPPFEFRVEYNWRQNAQIFNRLDLFNTLAYNMGFLAISSWNGDVVYTAFPYHKYRINMRFVGKKTGPVLRVKHLMWALEEMFDIYVENDRYESGSVFVDITPDRLAIGNVQATPVQRVGSLGPSLRRNTTEINLGDSWLTATSPFQNESLTTGITPPENHPRLLTTPKDKRIEIDAQYRAHGASLPVEQIYNATLKLLLLTGETPNILAPIGPVLSIYNDMADFTLSFTSTPFLKNGVLTYLDCLNSIGALTVIMSEQGVGGMWAEMDGFVRDGRVVLGKFCINKGDKRGLEAGEVCTLKWPGPEVGAVDVA